MIHKIERVASVGRFRDYTAAGDIAFRKLTRFGHKTTANKMFMSECKL